VNLIDWLIIAFVFLGALSGYRRGLVAALLGFVGYVAAVVAASLYSPVLVVWINKQGRMTQNLAEFFRKKLSLTCTAGQGLPAGNPGGNPGETLKYLQDILVQSPENIGGVADAFCYQLASLTVQVLAFALLLIISVAVIRLLVGFLSRRMRGIILGAVNRLGGFIVGGAINALIISLLVVILTPLLAVGAASSGGLLTGISKSLKQSTLIPYFVQFFAWAAASLFQVKF